MSASGTHPDSFWHSNFRWLAGGFLMMLCSGFGQTYYIAIFAGHLKADLSISDGLFGSLYTVATISSAALLIWAGKLADKYPVRWLGAAIMLGLALTSLVMASVTSVWILVFILFGLRFFGQGMITHVAMTAMGRWFTRNRGRAVSIAALGLPASEATMPLIAVTLIGLVGWRMTWVVSAATLVVLALPALVLLLRRERHPTTPALSDPDNSIFNDRVPDTSWTRAEVLKSPLFYAMMPAIMAPPFIMTGIFFNQVTIVEIKHWQLSWFAASFTIMAITHILSLLASGWLVDRFGARYLLPTFLIPLGVAILVLIYSDDPYILTIFMALTGLVMGSSSAVQGALWAELYGTAHLGAIRSIIVSCVVFASALSPGLIGVLLDAGISFNTQLIVMAIYSLVAAFWVILLMPALNRLATT